MMLPEVLYNLSQKDLAGNFAEEVAISSSIQSIGGTVSSEIQIPQAANKLFFIDTASFMMTDTSGTNPLYGYLLLANDGAGIGLYNGQNFFLALPQVRLNGSTSVITGLNHNGTMQVGVNNYLSLWAVGQYGQNVSATTMNVFIHGWVVPPGGIFR